MHGRIHFLFVLILCMPVLTLSQQAVGQSVPSGQTQRTQISASPDAAYDLPIGIEPFAEKIVRDGIQKDAQAFTTKNQQKPNAYYEANLIQQYHVHDFLSLQYRVLRSAGEARPDSYIQTFVLDLKTNTQLSITDMFTDVSAGLKLLQAQTVASLDIPTEALTAEHTQFENVVLTPSGIQVVFPLYKFGPRSDGERSATTPYSALRLALKPEFVQRLKLGESK